MRRLVMWGVPLLTLATAGCGAGATTNKATGPHQQERADQHWIDPLEDYPTPRTAAARPEAPPPPPVVIRGATILTATGTRIEQGDIVLRDGTITYIGEAAGKLPANAELIDGTGRFVTPGLIDSHSHIGVYAKPNVQSHEDGNEMTSPATPQLRASYAYNPQDPAITRAHAGGVTVAQILPGSANLIGGLGFVVEMKLGTTAGEVQFPGAPATIKMACGENPKGIYEKKGGPSTRMGEYAAFRQLFQQAAEYEARSRAYQRARTEWEQKRARATASGAAGGKPEPAPTPPPRDDKLATLAGVLRGEILPQVHCYKASEIAEMVAIADEFGFSIRGFHHALEAYKVRDMLVAHNISVSTWADWWGFKMEALDGIPENAALIEQAGGRPVIHSDSPVLIQRLNQEAAKAMYAGRAAGIAVTEDQALRWITANAAWTLGIQDQTGTLEVGKRADVVLWSAHPFSVYAHADRVFIAGEAIYDRAAGRTPTDFELGNSATERGNQ